jgi:ferredoxin-NADP reductase
LLISGGIGVTAVRSLLEDLPQSAEPVVVMRASTKEDLVLLSEVIELVALRKGRVYEWVGPRSDVKLDRLAQLVPDFRKRDVYVSGPRGFVSAVTSLMSRMGVPAEALHFEAYELA